jgi:O-antigen/teichoic acid export membrane protein
MQRAAAGVFVIATRGVLIMVLGAIGNVIVARVLTPGDFGVVAFGMSVVLFSQLVSDGGLGAGLIRRAEPPDAAELGAFSAFQLMVTGVATAGAVTVAVVSPAGDLGWVTAVMVASMPFVALQFPGRILLERALLYRRLALVELVQSLCFQAWAVGTVLAGWGVWGLATATVIRALVGAIVMGCACPEGLVRPRFSWRLIKPLMGFGLRFQAVNAAWIVGEQSLNVCVGVIGGIAALGLWTLARKVLEVPYLLVVTLWRVSFPTMSKLTAARAEVGPLMERAVGMAAVSVGSLLTGIAAGAPGLIPGLFGEQWRDASTILPGACLAVAIGGSLSVATQGYLYAVGDVTAVLRAEIAQWLVLCLVALPLLPAIGVVSIGIGWSVAAVAQSTVLVRATRRRIPVGLLRPLVAPVAVAFCAASLGWTITLLTGSDFWAGMTGAICAVLLFWAGLAVMNRKMLTETYRVARYAVRSAVRRRMSVAEA